MLTIQEKRLKRSLFGSLIILLAIHIAAYEYLVDTIEPAEAAQSEISVGEFASDVQDFVLAASKYQLPLQKPIRIEDLVVEFGDMTSSDEDGYCLTRHKQTPIVRIRKKAWVNASQTQKKMLLFHELGHCILDRNHRDTFIRVEGKVIPSSLMNSEAFDEKTYLDNEDYYLQELFIK